MADIATDLRHTAPHSNVGKKFDWGQPFVYLIALVVVGIAIVPVLYVVLNGFRTTGALNADPAGLPDPWIFSNYASVLASESFWRQVLNSTVAALGTTIGAVLLGVMAAFVIARYEFKGRDAMYSLFTAGLLFPISVAILPLYLMLKNFGLLGSLAGI